MADASKPEVKPKSIGERGMQAIQGFREKVTSRGGIAIFVVLALVCLALLVAFLVMKFWNATTKGVTVISTPQRLWSMGTQTRVDQASIPPTVNGQEFSFSFWMYMVDFVPTEGSPQLVFMRNTSSGTTEGANPIVAFDGSTNKLHIAVKTNKALPGAKGQAIFASNSGYVVGTIEYVPLQRWVHIAGEIQDSIMSIFIDGSLYTVANVADIQTSSRPIFSSSTGNIVVGYQGLNNEVRETRGYIMLLQVYNYALSPSEVAKIYAAGPSSPSIFAKIGLAGYGLRSPVFKMDGAT
jgi:hypothetical protein